MWSCIKSDIYIEHIESLHISVKTSNNKKKQNWSNKLVMQETIFLRNTKNKTVYK